jgi:hypothetical protein
MSDIGSLDSARKKKMVENNVPSKETVLERLREAIEIVESGEYTPNKIVILMLDDSDDRYDVEALSGGAKAQDAAFLSLYAGDLFKSYLLPLDYDE